MHASVRIINTGARSQVDQHSCVDRIHPKGRAGALARPCMSVSDTVAACAQRPEERERRRYETPCTVDPPVDRMVGGRVELVF